MTTSLQTRPTAPSGNPPSTNLRATAPPAKRPHVVLAVAGVAIVALLLGGGLGFALGGATADPPRACLDALAAADGGLALAVDDLRGIAEGLSTVVDGELPEAYGVLGEVRLRIAELRGFQADYRAAAVACREG